MLECNQNCSQFNLTGCHVQVTVDEDCGNCPLYNDGDCSTALYVPAFVPPGSIKKSFVATDDEFSQTVTFQIAIVEGDAFVLRGSQPPTIDASTGDLVVCLTPETSGNVTFEVFMQDSGGTANGGEDTFGRFRASIRVYPVNTEPSFDVCEIPDGQFCGPVGTCCNDHVLMWENYASLQIPQFLTTILKGTPDAFGNDTEPEQLATFSIEPLGSNLVVVNSSLSLSDVGTLQLRILDAVRGIADFTVTMLDDGFGRDLLAGTQAKNARENTNYGGVDSTQRSFRVHVLNSFAVFHYALASPASEATELQMIGAVANGLA
eukprot:64200-Rhodomonas_salina.1